MVMTRAAIEADDIAEHDAPAVTFAASERDDDRGTTGTQMPIRISGHEQADAEDRGNPGDPPCLADRDLVAEQAMAEWRR